MEITKMLDKYLIKKVDYLTIKNDVMKCFAADGFLTLYNEYIKQGASSKEAYDVCSSNYEYFFGKPRYSSYQVFLNNNFTDKDSDKKLRIYLLSYFKEKGFDSWASFKPLIICYFPQVTSEKLLLFYNGKQLDKEVLKYVDYVRQIIGK